MSDFLYLVYCFHFISRMIDIKSFKCVAGVAKRYSMANYITERCIGCGICKNNCVVLAIEGQLREQHSINAKRCIECNVCGRLCPMKAIESSDGTVLQNTKRTEWGKIVINKHICSACGICVDSCIFEAIRISMPKYMGDIEVYAEVYDENKCVSCMLCMKRCPLNAISVTYPRDKEGI